MTNVQFQKFYVVSPCIGDRLTVKLRWTARFNCVFVVYPEISHHWLEM